MGPNKNMKSLYPFPKSAYIHINFLLYNFGEFLGNFGYRPIPLFHRPLNYECYGMTVAFFTFCSTVIALENRSKHIRTVVVVCGEWFK